MHFLACSVSLCQRSHFIIIIRRSGVSDCLAVIAHMRMQTYLEKTRLYFLHRKYVSDAARHGISFTGEHAFLSLDVWVLCVNCVCSVVSDKMSSLIFPLLFLCLLLSHFAASVPMPASFPHFGLHCEGYNEVRGPSHGLVSRIFMATVDRESDFLDRCVSFTSPVHLLHICQHVTFRRFMCGLGGESVTSDQHHHISRKIRVLDEQTVAQEKPADGLIALANEKSQVGLQLFCVRYSCSQLSCVHITFVFLSL